MTRQHGFPKMSVMRKMMVMAAVAVAAVQMMWRVVRPPKVPAFAMDWTADE
jgi:hypothetical protein